VGKFREWASVKAGVTSENQQRTQQQERTHDGKTLRTTFMAFLTKKEVEATALA
jgi:hypothetical protein